MKPTDLYEWAFVLKDFFPPRVRPKRVRGYARHLELDLMALNSFILGLITGTNLQSEQVKKLMEQIKNGGEKENGRTKTGNSL